jgi:hypothetical protein
MKLVMTLVVRDEADILEANLAYHFSQGVDLVLATDNGSTDGSREILERYQGMGLLHLFEEPGDLRQSEWVTRMARLAATEMQGDWVISVDADELWWPRAGTLKAVLAALPEDVGMVVAPKTNFLGRRPETGFFAERMTVREVRSPWHSPGSSASLRGRQPKIAHRASPEVVYRGMHSLQAPGLSPVPGWHPFFVFHFQARDFATWKRRRLHHAAALDRGGLPERPLMQVARDHEAGVLDIADVYREELLVEEEGLEEALSEGRLVVDHRLRRVLHGLETAQGDGLAAPGTHEPERLAGESPEFADLLGSLMSALEERERSDRRAERTRARAEHRVATARARAKQAERRAKAAEARLGEARRRPW